MQSNFINPANDFQVKMEDQTIRKNVIATIASSPTKISSAALGKILSAKYRLEKEQIKTVIKDLVSIGAITYTYEFGSTFVERSVTNPVRVSKHVVLKPPGLSYRHEPEDVVVQIKPGAAFGTGRHPTTRLAIRGIEFVLLDGQAIHRSQNRTVLDIGTGSGVLVITALLAGMDRGLGIDMDPCARVEAVANAKINDLADRIVISGQAVNTIKQRFSMITANLRYPSLKMLSTRLTEITDEKGAIILSGIKEDEVASLLAVYTKKNFECLWTAKETGWASVVLKKIG